MKDELRNAKVCNVTDNMDVQELTSDPTVTCGRCGATAHDAANVCVPVKR